MSDIRLFPTTYNNAVRTRDLISWISTNILSKDPQQLQVQQQEGTSDLEIPANDFIMELVSRNILAPCTRKLSISSKFSISTFPSSEYYQWKEKEIPPSAGDGLGPSRRRHTVSRLDFEYVITCVLI